jgi:hypothetical protein
VRYTPGVVSGWISEEPSRTQDECRQLGREEATARIGRLLREFMPGDGVRGLQHHTSLRDESIDLTLAPVWVFALRWDEKKPPVRILVNGQTGKAFGKVPLSWAKVGLIVAAVAGLIALIRLLAWLLR